MNDKILIGINKVSGKQIVVDARSLSVCLVVGGWASGKTVWLNGLYAQLNSETSGEYAYLDINDKKDLPIVNKPDHIFSGAEQCLKALSEYAELAEQRSKQLEPSTDRLVIHIEGHDLVYFNKEHYFAVISKLARYAKTANINVLLVVSRYHSEEIPMEYIKLCTLKAVFAGDTYATNSRKLGFKTMQLGPFEKQIELEGSCFVIKATHNEK